MHSASLHYQHARITEQPGSLHLSVCSKQGHKGCCTSRNTLSHHSVTRRSSFKSPVNLGGEGAQIPAVRSRYQLFPSFTVTHFLHQSFYLSHLSLRCVQAAFLSSILHTVSTLSVTQSTAAIITTAFSGHHGGSSTSAFSSAAQSKRPSIIESLDGNRAPKILTGFNFHIPAPAINIICNYSLVSPDTTVKNNKMVEIEKSYKFFFFFHLSI